METSFQFLPVEPFFALKALNERISNKDKHLFENDMLSEQGIVKIMLLINELSNKLDSVQM